MPDKNFSRAGSGDSERKLGEAPNLGRVARTPLSAVPGGRRRRTHRKRKSNAARKWTLVLSFVLILAMSAFFVRHFREKVAKAREADGPSILATAFQERKTLELPHLDRQEALAFVKAAFAGISVEAVDDYFVLSPADNPGNAIDALQHIRETEGTITEYEWLGQRFSNGSTIAEVITRMSGTDGNKSRVAQLVFGADRKWRVDLDSYLRKCVPEWTEILSGESDKCLVRVFVGRDTYYNGAYSDEEKWQSFTLASADDENFIYAYVKKGSAQERALRKIFESGADVNSATLMIAPVADARNRQFEITSVLAEGWVVGESRFDASF